MNCKNCHSELNETSDFCSSCGAKVIRNRLTLRNLFSDLSEQFLSYDNKFFQTTRDLIKCPENVINSYIEGVRKRHINPVSYFAIALTISGLYLFVLQTYFPDAMNFSVIYNDDVTQKVSEKISDTIMDYNSIFYFALIPLLALVSLIVFFNKKYNYTEHIVIYLYTMSLGAVVSSVISSIVLLTNPESIIYTGLSMNVILIIFHCYLLKRIFHLSIMQIFLKTLLFAVVFGICYMIFSIALVIVLLIFTDLSLKDFVPNK